MKINCFVGETLFNAEIPAFEDSIDVAVKVKKVSEKSRGNTFLMPVDARTHLAVFADISTDPLAPKRLVEALYVYAFLDKEGEWHGVSLGSILNVPLIEANTLAERLRAYEVLGNDMLFFTRELETGDNPDTIANPGLEDFLNFYGSYSGEFEPEDKIK